MATKTDQFSFTYNPITAADAQKQIASQLDPLYNRSVQNINSQKYQSDVQSGQVAAARGLGHSGLAADQLNKIAIAAQGQIGDLSAQRMTQIAQLSNDLMERDKDRGMQARSQAYSEWMGQQNLSRDDRNYDYQVGRDKIADSRYKTEWDYQVGRDNIADKRYDTEWKYQKGRDKINDAWRQKEWSQMSPAEKQRAALDFEYAKKKATLNKSSGGGRGRSRSSSSSSSTMSAAQIVEAAKMKAIREQQAQMSKTSPKLNPKAKKGVAAQPGSYWYARGYGSQYLPK